MLLKNVLSCLILLALFACGSAPAPKTAATMADFPILSKGAMFDILPQVRDDRITVFDFYADWCGPCKLLERSLKDLKATYGDKLEIMRLNIDSWDSELAKNYKIRDLPFLMVYDRGKEPLMMGQSGEILPKLIAHLNR